MAHLTTARLCSQRRRAPFVFGLAGAPEGVEALPVPKRVLCIMDLPVAGRAGLSAVLPVLAACGVQACALPPLLLSTHTGGFGPPARAETAAFGEEALAHFTREGVLFDAVYTGYLSGDAQFALARRAMALWPGALCLADPAMGDDGVRYSGLAAGTEAHMRRLCAGARLITPNYTESALLLGEDAGGPPPAAPDESEALRRLQALCTGGRSVLITSVPTAGGYATMGQAAGQTQPFVIPSRRVPQRYPGTGDLLAAAVCGRLLRGDALHTAARRAAAFVEEAARATYEGGGAPREGLWFEPFLPLLAP